MYAGVVLACCLSVIAHTQRTGQRAEMSGPTIGNERVRTQYSFECSLAFFSASAHYRYLFCVLWPFFFYKKKTFSYILFFIFGSWSVSFECLRLESHRPHLANDFDPLVKKIKKLRLFGGSIDRHGRTKEKTLDD